jgi:zinc transport system substrate-binding protein
MCKTIRSRRILTPNRIFLLCFVLLPFASLLPSCFGKTVSGGGEADAWRNPPDIPHIIVSILPQTYFINRIAGGRVAVTVLTGPGQNPHDYEPTPRQMAALAEARAWILSGAEFETALRPKVEAVFPGLNITDGTHGVVFRSLEDGDDHDGHGHEDGQDRHTWLGREPAKIMAGHILEVLLDLQDGNGAFYRKNYEELILDIDGEFKRLKEELAPLRGKTVFVYHPAFGYFLDEFGIIQEAVETGGKEPTPRLLSRLITEARDKRPQAVFVQAQFPVEAAGAVAKAAGAELAVLDPLAPDWLENIRRMGRILRYAGTSAPL